MTKLNYWIVMTSSAKMPNSVMARYRNVALVKRTQEYAEQDLTPKMIATHAKGVAEIRHRGHHHVGKTDKSAYAIALADAEEDVRRLNLAANLAAS